MTSRTESTSGRPSPPDRPKIAHVIDSLSIAGGAERQLAANLNAFDHDMIEHHVVLFRNAPEKQRAIIPDRVRVWNLGREEGQTRRTTAVRRLVSLVRAERFDLIHASLPDSALAARIAGMTTPAVVVESLVNISHEPIRTVDNPHVTRAKLRLHIGLDRLTTKGVDRFHAVSQAVADSWETVVGIDPDSIEVIPRGIDRGSFGLEADRDEARRQVRLEFGFPEKAFLVVAVGRLEPQKGHRYLLEAIAEIRDEIPDLRLLIVGRDGVASPAIAAQLERDSLDDIVSLPGARRDIPRLLSASDVFAFPSLFEGNGGNAMIEAMAMGLPIITTDSPPMTDLVPSDEFGRLVPRLDSEAIATALLELSADSELRARLGKAARDRASGFPTPAEISQTYEAWYGRLLGMGDSA